MGEQEMFISDAQVEHVAQLARLALSTEEKQRFTEQLNAILAIQATQRGPYRRCGTDGACASSRECLAGRYHAPEAQCGGRSGQCARDGSALFCRAQDCRVTPYGSRWFDHTCLARQACER